MRKMEISAIVLAKNEAARIGECLESLFWCSEIVVIDDNSTDKTEILARSLSAKIFKSRLNNNFAAQRNYGLTKIKTDWALFVDADELVSPALKKEIEGLNPKNKVAFVLKRQDYLWGRRLKYGENGKMTLIRLVKKSNGVWKRDVHEYWEAKGEVGKLQNPLFHFPHQTLGKFLTQINFHSSLHALANKKEGKKSSIVKIIFYPIAKFFHNYILKLGLFDDLPGFVASVMMSLHSFLAWSKLWLIEHKK